MNSSKKLALLVVFMLIPLTGCTTLFPQPTVTGLYTRASASDEWNSESAIYSNVKKIYVMGTLDYDVCESVVLSVFIDGVFSDRGSIGYWGPTPFFGSVDTTCEAETYLPEGNYYLKINGAGANQEPWVGGELTITISNEISSESANASMP